jgi:hypothetical protein
MLPQVPQYATLYSSTSKLPITDTPFSMLISPVTDTEDLRPFWWAQNYAFLLCNHRQPIEQKGIVTSPAFTDPFEGVLKKFLIWSHLSLYFLKRRREYLESWNASSCGMMIRVPDMVWNVYPSVYRLCPNIEFSAITQHLDFVDFVLLIYPLNSPRK